MIKSMTGFGQAQLKTRQSDIRIELKSVNHKFFEISSRFPGHLAEYEEGVRKAVSQEIRRGKVTLFIQSPDPSVYSARLVLNEPLAKEVFQKILRLKKILGVSEKVSADAVFHEVLRTPDVLTKESSPAASSVFSRDLFRVLNRALQSLHRSRILEGRALEKDLRKRVAEIQNFLRGIEKRIPLIAREYKKNLASRMKEFIKNEALDPERLTLEVALYVKNSDISEEVTRLKSHLDALRKTLGEKGELGRKIDFIGQEMTREINTIGAKSADVTIAENVIGIKSTIEKIREQSQNVE